MLSPLYFNDYCLRCGGLIENRRSDALYCSTDCSDRYYHELERDARLAEKAKRPPCRRCGTPIPIERLSTAVYCSRACQSVVYADVRKAKNLERTRNRPPCKHCGTPIAPSAYYPKTVYCSVECRSAGGAEKICKNCGAAFKGKANRKYCGLQCAAQKREAVKRDS